MKGCLLPGPALGAALLISLPFSPRLSKALSLRAAFD